MKVAIASDHRGFEAKRKLVYMLKQWGHEISDLGCDAATSCDYPDFAVLAGRAVVEGRCDVGILIDGSGIGMCIAANKLRGIYAALAHDEVAARRSREHHHCNVLCLGADLLSEGQIAKVVEAFLAAAFLDGRHTRRIEKVREIERSFKTRT